MVCLQYGTLELIVRAFLERVDRRLYKLLKGTGDVFHNEC